MTIGPRTTIKRCRKHGLHGDLPEWAECPWCRIEALEKEKQEALAGSLEVQVEAFLKESPRGALFGVVGDLVAMEKGEIPNNPKERARALSLVIMAERVLYEALGRGKGLV